MDNDHLEFRGGKYTSFIPFIFFLIGCMVMSILGYAGFESFSFIAAIGVALSVLLARDPQECFESIVKGTATDLITVVIFCWVFSGIFAGILGASELVNGLIWLGIKTGIRGSLFVPLAFILTCLYSTSIGTGVGSILAMSSMLYPTGIALGANPYVLAGAIISGSCFGDNLAPISDTTIVAAASMGVDITGVMKTRLPYTLTAGFFSLIGYTFLGFVFENSPRASSVAHITQMFSLSPRGLFMLIPPLIVVIMALKGTNLVLSMSVGSILALCIGLPIGMIRLSNIISFRGETFGGAAIEGMCNFTGLMMLVFLTYALSHIVIASGAMDDILAMLQPKIHNQKMAEIFNWCIIALSSFVLCSNVSSQIVAGPFMKQIADEFDLSLYRTANYSDAVQNMFGYLLPWSGPSIVFCTSTILLSRTYAWCLEISSPAKLILFTIHPMILGVVYLFMALTGTGMKRDKRIEEEQILNSVYNIY